ncbi:MAG: hypothetical protein AAFY60_11835, partial [Myxococcota bacterium]
LDAVSSFGEQMEALGQAAGISIVSEAHRHHRSVAQRFGAVYKPSGAGGGDIGVAFWAQGGSKPFEDALPLAIAPATP